MSNPWTDDVERRAPPAAPERVADAALSVARRAAEALALLGVLVIVVEALAGRDAGLHWSIVGVAASVALLGMLLAGVLAHGAAQRSSPLEGAAVAGRAALLCAAGPAALAVWFSRASPELERISVPFGVFLTLVGPLSAVIGAGLGFCLAATRGER